MNKYTVGLDLGQAQDYTALCVLERIEDARQVPDRTDKHRERMKTEYGPHKYECKHLERLPLGTLYPAIVERIKELLETPELNGQSSLVIDATGVGRPVCDMFRAAGLAYSGVTITGGDSINRDGPLTRVPKRILVSTLQVLLQSERLKVAPNQLRETLVTEMLNFRVTITEAANDTYGGRSGAHDDIVLAVALAAWKAEQYRHVAPPQSTQKSNPAWPHSATWGSARIR